jgi:hypothetical protein
MTYQSLTSQKATVAGLTAMVITLLSACQSIHVIDPTGQPIEGVQITTQYVDEEGTTGPGPSSVTDAMGNAMLSRSLLSEDPTWMTLERKGYMPLGIDYPTDWYVVIELQPIGNTLP